MSVEPSPAVVARVTAETRVVERANVIAPLRRALDDPGAELLDCATALVPGTSPTCGGVYRLGGTARSHGRERRWRLVLKVLRPLHEAFVANIRLRTPALVDAVVGAVRWDREALAYRSGLLSDLPVGLVAPRCHGAEERPSDGVWLWLEDVGDGRGRWGLEDFARAAEQIGRFNGAYLTGRPLPDEPWLARESLSPYIRLLAAEGRAVVTDPARWESLLARTVFPRPPLDRLARIWDDFDVFHKAVRRLPRTFCHHDAHQDNLFFRDDGDMAAIDWQMSGLGAVGEDAGQLVAYALKLYTVPGEQAVDLDRAVFGGYLAGLRRAGWTGDAGQARLGYAATLAPRHALQVPQLNMLADTTRHAAIEQRRGMPMLEIARHHAAVTGFLLDLADEARSLIAAGHLLR